MKLQPATRARLLALAETASSRAIGQDDAARDSMQRGQLIRAGLHLLSAALYDATDRWCEMATAGRVCQCGHDEADHAPQCSRCAPYAGHECRAFDNLPNARTYIGTETDFVGVADSGIKWADGSNDALSMEDVRAWADRANRRDT